MVTELGHQHGLSVRGSVAKTSVHARLSIDGGLAVGTYRYEGRALKSLELYSGLECPSTVASITANSDRLSSAHKRGSSNTQP